MSKNKQNLSAKIPQLGNIFNFAPAKKLNINTQGTGRVGGQKLNKKSSAAQRKHEKEIQKLEDIAFDHENEQSKDNKTDDNAESGADTVPELVSVEAGNVGNHIGADFWEQDEELPSNSNNAGTSEQVSNGADSSNNLHEHGVLESLEREDIDINEEREEEEEEDEEDEEE
tara:strand:- start:1141 stop:1653 length:513 start_codon:yes stop_codon:yes gene_type:complete